MLQIMAKCLVLLPRLVRRANQMPRKTFERVVKNIVWSKVCFRAKLAEPTLRFCHRALLLSSWQAEPAQLSRAQSCSNCKFDGTAGQQVRWAMCSG